MVNKRNTKKNRKSEKDGVGVSAREKLTGALRTLTVQRETENPTTTSQIENFIEITTPSPHFNIMPSSNQNNNRISYSYQSNSSVEMANNRMQNNEENILEEKYYLMRLYGRNINLGKFRHDTNLYPVCRDWVANQFQLQCRNTDDELDSKICEKNEEQKSKNYYKLPAPLPLDPGVLSLRVPTPSPVVKQGINFNYNSANVLLGKEELLKGHLKRWRSVRKKWMNANAEDEKRYYKSKKILKKMYDRTQAEF